MAFPQIQVERIGFNLKSFRLFCFIIELKEDLVQLIGILTLDDGLVAAHSCRFFRLRMSKFECGLDFYV